MATKTAIEHLAEQHARIREMQAYIPGLVLQARFEGASWADVGRAIGCSRAEAHRKYKMLGQPVDHSGPAGPAGGPSPAE